MALQSFFYDQQIRRYIIQFIRMVSNFQVEFGNNREGNKTLQRVPVIYGDSSRQAATIIKQNSENIMNAVPAMAVYIGGMQYDRERLQSPTFVGKLNVRERYYDPETGDYTTTEGDVLTVERLMPVPYRLTLKLDIWTSNTEQKLQLLEQICTLFNPALEIQSTDNYVDWTSITYVLLTDVSWSSRAVPVGTDTPIDVATLTFELPIFISAPALVKKMGVVQKIIASIFDSRGDLDAAIYNEDQLISRQYLTPLQYGVILLDNSVKLVKYNEPVVDEFGIQIIKEIRENVTANANIVLNNSDGVEPGMLISGMTFANGAGTINGNVGSNTINGTGTAFVNDLDQNSIVYYSTIALGTVANVVSNTQVTLAGNLQYNFANVPYAYSNSIKSGDPYVISVDGDTVLASNIITANTGASILFSSVTHKIGPWEPWRDLVNLYGNLVNGSSQIRFELEDGNEVTGTVAYNPVDDTSLLWTPDVDTIPANTLSPINAIIDPQTSRPNLNTQVVSAGTRYLLINDYIVQAGEQPVFNWVGFDNTPITAYANDIIEFNGTHWAVVFDAQNVKIINYVTNLTTGIQYKWNGNVWSKSYEGYYRAGRWQLII